MELEEQDLDVLSKEYTHLISKDEPYLAAKLLCIVAMPCALRLGKLDDAQRMLDQLKGLEPRALTDLEPGTYPSQVAVLRDIAEAALLRRRGRPHRAYELIRAAPERNQPAVSLDALLHLRDPRAVAFLLREILLADDNLPDEGTPDDPRTRERMAPAISVGCRWKLINKLVEVAQVSTHPGERRECLVLAAQERGNIARQVLAHPNEASMDEAFCLCLEAGAGVARLRRDVYGDPQDGHLAWQLFMSAAARRERLGLQVDSDLQEEYRSQFFDRTHLYPVPEHLKEGERDVRRWANDDRAE